MQTTQRIIVTITSAMLAACGGGSSSTPVTTTPPVTPTGPTTPVDPTPPVVTPPAAACAVPVTNQTQVLFDKTPMLAICDGVYVEPTATADDQLALRQSVAGAYTTVTKFYGEFTAPHPQMIFCQTQSCRSYFMGSYAGVYSPLGLKLPNASYTAGKPTIFITYTSFVGQAQSLTVAHELTHTETLYRYGGGGVPSWFNEGIATLVGNYPDCTRQTANYVSDFRTVDFEAVVADSSKGDAVYCQASREVNAWITVNGKPNLIDLLAGVKAGNQFYTLYGNLINR